MAVRGSRYRELEPSASSTAILAFSSARVCSRNPNEVSDGQVAMAFFTCRGLRCRYPTSKTYNMEHVRQALRDVMELLEKADNSPERNARSFRMPERQVLRICPVTDGGQESLSEEKSYRS
jgi:hypothetical protein